MQLNKLPNYLKTLNQQAKKKNKKTCFLIGTTKKNSRKDFYFTPMRESQKTLYMGVIVYSNNAAKVISQKIDGKVNYIFVDIEKKIKNKKDILVNIERSTKEIINKSIIKNYKPNDLTVNSIENFIQDYYRSDRRGVGGKKILVAGVGNIGFKIALRLLESGGSVYLTRRNKKKLQLINAALNSIKPEQTRAKSFIVNIKKLSLENYDVIIGCANENIIFKTIKDLKKIPLIIDVGKNTFDKKNIKKLSKMKIPIFWLDVENSLSSFIDNNILTENFFNDIYSKKIGKWKLIKRGILGNTGDIIVDNVSNPKRIIGVCGKNGMLENLSEKEYNIIKSKIFRNEK